MAGFERVLASPVDYVVQMDCDFSHQPSYIPEMMRTAETCDLVIGSRYAPGGSVDSSWSWFREKLSWFANSVYVSTLLNIPVYDATGGFRLWRKEALQGIDRDQIRSTGYIATVELAYVAYRLGYRITEIPIHFPDRTLGQSKMSLKVQLEAAYRVWEIRQLHRHLTPGRRLSERFA
jgi:dolichol-phosphate mannosyltransferase